MEKEEMGGGKGAGEGKLIFKRVFSDTPQGAKNAQFVVDPLNMQILGRFHCTTVSRRVGFVI